MDRIVGQSEAMREVYRHIRQAAATDIPVLLVGETGTGKDLVARTIHNRGERCDGPFVAANLGALPHQLVPAALFGHEKGAFTGATEQKKGKFELATGGTIFLDEIASVNEKVQIGLLRLIEQRKFHRIGGRKEIHSDARLIAASNEDLYEAVQKGSFREDLYYRLDVFRISLPPLREREKDIALLVDEFIKRYNPEFNKNIRGVSPECINLLESYGWPGNIRELKNVIQRAVLVCNEDVLMPEDLPPRFCEQHTSRQKVSFEIGTPLEEIEREMVIKTLEAANNNRTTAAKLLGISRRALYNKMQKYKID